MKALLLSMALIACGSSRSTPQPLSNHAAVIAAPAVDAAVDAGPIGVAAMLARLDQFADDMCRCGDRDCADAVMDEMTRWAQELASAGEGTPKVNDTESAQAKAAAERVTKCMSGLYRKRPGSALSP